MRDLVELAKEAKKNFNQYADADAECEYIMTDGTNSVFVNEYTRPNSPYEAVFKVTKNECGDTVVRLHKKEY